MKSLLKLLVVASLLALPLAATAKKSGPPFAETADQSLTPAPADRARIVFLEPANAIAGAFAVAIYDMDGDKRTLLAITGSHTKAVVDLTPGHHVLVANTAMFAHYMEADVEAGKTYYVLARFVYAHGFQLRPLRTAGPSDYSIANREFASWNSDARFVQPTPEGIAAFEKLEPRVAKSQAKGLEEWNRKTPEERAELTLTPQDAVAPAAAATPNSP